METAADPFALTKFKPLSRGKMRDSFVLSEQGNAVGHLYEGAVRSGKTISSLVRWLLFVVEGPPGNLAMIGKTERTLKRNVLDTIVQLLGPKKAKIIVGSGIMRIAGREIYLIGANDEGAVAKIQGMTLVGWYGDEAPTWPKDVFNMARTRCSEPGAEWFATGNPASSTHHLKTDWIDRAALHLRRDGTLVRRNGRDAQNVHVYSFTIYDNPHLTSEFVRLLETSYTGMFRRRNILGEWCMAEGAIYDAWDPDRHVLPFSELPPLDRWIGAGVDYGTVNPFHAVDLGIGPAPRGRPGRALYITSEYRYDSAKHVRRMTDLEYATAMRSWLREIPHPSAPAVRGLAPEILAIDPSAASYRVQLHSMGMMSVLADNNVLAGIRDMSNLIAHDRLFVCGEGAPELIKEIPNYAWDDRAAKLGEDKPIKTGDHGLDAKRYIGRTSREDWWEEIFPELLDIADLDKMGSESSDAPLPVLAYST